MSSHHETAEPLFSANASPQPDGQADAIELPTIDDLDVEGRRVLLRADLDVPLTSPATGIPVRVRDDTRIRAALTTIDQLRVRGARLVLLSHLARQQGYDPIPSMRPVAGRLAELIGEPVALAPGVTGSRVQALTEQLEPGQMLLLENAWSATGDTHNDPRLATALAELADIYVNDAFARAHLAEASTTGVAERLPSAAGRLMQREVNALSAITHRPGRPLVALIGGAPSPGKIELVERLLDVADKVCIGCGMCFSFLAAHGHSVGASLCPRDDADRARVALAAATHAGGRLALPQDLVVARWSGGKEPATRTVAAAHIPDGWMGLDIGPSAARSYAAEILAAQTVFWGGAVGRFELPLFAAGTHAIANAVASTSAATVAAGEETLQALSRFGMHDRVGYVSGGGHAALELLAGRDLPGVQVLCKQRTAAASRRRP